MYRLSRLRQKEESYLWQPLQCQDDHACITRIYKVSPYRADLYVFLGFRSPGARLAPAPFVMTTFHPTVPRKDAL